MSDDGADARGRLVRALDAVEAAGDLPDLKRAVDALVAPYGLEHAVFYAFGRPGVADGRDTVLFTYPPEWVDHYMRRRYHGIDPVVQAGVRSLTPVDWASLDKAPPAVRRLFDEAAEVGVGRQGLTLPSRGPAGAQALLHVTSNLPDRDWRALRIDLMRDMGVVGAHLHAKLLSLETGTPPGAGTVRLSGREREVLQWAAVGRTIDQTAAVLGLSSSAVRTYLDAARRKLNCLTKPQAVAVALRTGLIDG